jgi:hypothetical protein
MIIAMVVAAEQAIIPSLQLDDPTTNKIMPAGVKPDGLAEVR